MDGDYSSSRAKGFFEGGKSRRGPEISYSDAQRCRKKRSEAMIDNLGQLYTNVAGCSLPLILPGPLTSMSAT